jgi:hypothetical protein
MSIFKEAKTIAELRDLLSDLPDDLPVNLQQLKEMRSNILPKAELKYPEFTLNTENYSALFRARGEMIRSSYDSFIKGKIDYTHACIWKVPYDEPFTGINASELKEELTEKQTGGVLELNGGVLEKKGEILKDPSLLNLIMSDVSTWTRDSMKKKDVNFYVDEYNEVYDFKYSVSARLQNTAVLLEVSYI